MTTTYTTITPSSSTETIKITGTVESSQTIDVTASDPSGTHVLDLTHGLEIDFSGVTASSCTTTFKWDAGSDAYVEIDGVRIDSSSPEHDVTYACGPSSNVLDVGLIVGDPLGGIRSDPKIIPPSCS